MVRCAKLRCTGLFVPISDDPQEDPQHVCAQSKLIAEIIFFLFHTKFLHDTGNKSILKQCGREITAVTEMIKHIGNRVFPILWILPSGIIESELS